MGHCSRDPPANGRASLWSGQPGSPRGSWLSGKKYQLGSRRAWVKYFPRNLKKQSLSDSGNAETTETAAGWPGEGTWGKAARWSLQALSEGRASLRRLHSRPVRSLMRKTCPEGLAPSALQPPRSCLLAWDQRLVFRRAPGKQVCLGLRP